MTRPRLLDLFSGAGGAAMGYHRAGFDVVGVDLAPMPNYPFPFIQADALQAGAAIGHMFDAVHASPPCQAYSTITAEHAKTRHPQLIGPTRALLEALGVPYVIENVEGARHHLDHPVRLCGSSFGLRVRRHRYFQVSFPVLTPPCDHRGQGVPVGVYGDHPDKRPYLRPETGTSRAVKAISLDDARAAMGIDWMPWRELAESIPPAFTEYLGGLLLEELGAVAA